MAKQHAAIIACACGRVNLPFSDWIHDRPERQRPQMRGEAPSRAAACAGHALGTDSLLAVCTWFTSASYREGLFTQEWGGNTQRSFEVAQATAHADVIAARQRYLS
jgi:hypothetical protein